MSLVEAGQPRRPRRVKSDRQSLDAFMEAIKDPNVNAEKMRAILDMREKMFAAEAERIFNAEMRDVQAEMPRVLKDKTGDKNNRYATLEKIDNATRATISEHGFSESYGTAESHLPEHYRITCLVSHEAGHSRPYFADMPIVTKGAKGGDVMTPTHAFGSAMSYGRRYLKCLIWNIVTTNDDDDGKAAGGKVRLAISEEQEAELEKLIETTKGNKKLLLEHLRVPDLSHIYEDRFEDVRSEIIEIGRRRLEKERTR